MRIGEAAARSGIPAKTIRYYESVGLLGPASRTHSNYRDYGERDLHVLAFLKRARTLGFSIEDCRILLALWADRARSSSEVKALALRHLDRIDRKIDELKTLRRTLETLARHCHGDDRPDCPILEELAGAGPL